MLHMSVMLEKHMYIDGLHLFSDEGSRKVPKLSDPVKWPFASDFVKEPTTVYLYSYSDLYRTSMVVHMSTSVGSTFAVTGY